MAKYTIEITEEAKDDLDQYGASERKRLIQGIRVQLEDQPMDETKNRKKLRYNPIAPWGLRVGKHRVFYEVDQVSERVTIVAVGHKEHNVLFIRGKEVRI